MIQLWAYVMPLQRTPIDYYRETRVGPDQNHQKEHLDLPKVLDKEV